MPLDPFQELLLSEFKEMKDNLNQVRITDIPALKVDIAGFKKDVKDLENKQRWSTRLYTLIGGAIAVAIAKYTGHNS